MKVFEVITEYCKGDSKEITTAVEYVVSDRNTLLSVTEYFTTHCYEYDKDLISVKEVLTITQNIQEDESAAARNRIKIYEEEDDKG